MFEDDQDAGSATPTWMITFADMVTQILCFFVMLVSFADTNATHFHQALGSVKDAFGVDRREPGPHEGRTTAPVDLGAPTSRALIEAEIRAGLVTQTLARISREAGIESQIELEESGRGVVLRLQDQLLFDSGSDRLKPEAEPWLRKLAEVAALYPQGVSVEGHTDDRPIRTARFPSNWELSTARAIALLGALRARADLEGRRLRVMGYGDTQPIDDNAAPKGQARNRRVEVVFERPDRLDPSWPTTGAARREGGGASLGLATVIARARDAEDAGSEARAPDPSP